MVPFHPARPVHFEEFHASKLQLVKKKNILDAFIQMLYLMMVLCSSLRTNLKFTASFL